MRWAHPAIDIKMGLGIYDTGKVAFFSSPKENFVVLIESWEIQELLTSLFHMFWAVQYLQEKVMDKIPCSRFLNTSSTRFCQRRAP